MAVCLGVGLVTLGRPVLAGGRGGLAGLAGPTAGVCVGWIFAAFVTGYLSEQLVKPEQSGLVQGVGFFIAAVAGGVVVLYAFGIAWLAVNVGFSKAFLGSLGFVPGDVVKAVVAALVGRAVMVGYPLLPQRS